MHLKTGGITVRGPIIARDIKVPPRSLEGYLSVPAAANGLVIFAHGSGSSHLSPRNMRVAHALNAAGLATLLFDLLSPAEAEDRQNVFDIPLLASRLEEAVRWCAEREDTAQLPVGIFGASTGAGAALAAAAFMPERILAVVSRGGRPDLAGDALAGVRAHTLLIVGALDSVVIELNRRAMKQLACPVKLEIVPGATHLFEEPGTLDAVIDLARDWFVKHLIQGPAI
ncbi:MAG TPA: dienelactone hydrolase family protein [Hyphomicrobium sp.]|nr:dienelactone hydrolase family protein [Hyphomicrobium sp.]